MNILIACEESGIVTEAFRKRGHNAWSCDLLPTSGNHPEWHIKDDAIKILYSQKWDLVIAHPPCTRLANSGVRWLSERNLWEEMDAAADFFFEFIKYGLRSSLNKIAIENPIPHKHARLFIGDYTQLIQPWMFGHGEQKATCLWLYNLPKLHPTNIVSGREQKVWKMTPGPERTKLRSKTFPGIAKAMAEQWG